MKCCSLDMTPIIFTSAEEQRCVSNYTKSIIYIQLRYKKIKMINQQTGPVTGTTGLVVCRVAKVYGVGAPASPSFPFQKTSSGP